MGWQFLARIAKHLQRRLVHVEDHAGNRVMQEDGVTGRVEHLPVAPLAGAERRFRPPALGALLDLAQGPLHRRAQPEQPLFQHIVGGPAMQGLDGGLLPMVPETKMKGVSGHSFCAAASADRPS